MEYTEGAITVQVDATHSRPGHTEGFLNPRMRINRDLSLLTLAVLSSVSPSPAAPPSPIRCLDAFSATGFWPLLFPRMAFYASLNLAR